MANRQADVDHLHLQAAGGKIPPAWSPEDDRRYPLRFYCADVRLWARAADVAPEKMGPCAALRLGGSARAIVRELDGDVLAMGMQVQDPVGGGVVNISGLESLLRALNRRYGVLAEELEINALSEYFSYHRSQGEGIDEALSRWELVKIAAFNAAGLAITESGQAWLLLNSLRISPAAWPQLLIQTLGRLPQNQAQLTALIDYLRRNAHLRAWRRSSQTHGQSAWWLARHILCR